MFPNFTASADVTDTKCFVSSESLVRFNTQVILHTARDV